MANFKTHVTVSTMLGCGYGGLGYYSMELPWDTAMVAGGLCGLSGMLPDLDSDRGIPLRESMAFAAGIIPMLLVDRFRSLNLSYDQMVLLTAGLYFAIRFGLARMLARYTVHRGMFHSIPAGLIFAGAAFLIVGADNLELRYFKAAAVFAGFMSHLILDEIYSFEWKHGRWRLKKSFGTAVKLWGKSHWANFSTYAKLVLVAMMILSEPAVMEYVEARRPGFAGTYQQYFGEGASAENLAGELQSRGQQFGGRALEAAGSAWGNPVTNEQFAPQHEPYPANDLAPDRSSADDVLTNKRDGDRTIYDTAKRLYRKVFD